jgi:hypothetical protein
VLRKQISFVVLGLTLVASGQASASLGGDIAVNGFMSTGLAWTDANDIIVNSGITDQPTADKLTVFGLNFSSTVTDRLSFNAITVIRGREADPAMRLDTANLTYQLTNTFRVRAGKIRAPIWLISDYLDVKALQPWARAPEEFYEAPIDIFAYDGLSLIQSIPVGRHYIEVEAFGGAGKVASREKRIEIEGDVRDFVGLSARYFGRTFQVRGSWSRADIKNHTYWDLSNEDTTDTYGDPAQNRRAQTINPSPVDTSNMQFTSLGVQYDGYFFLWAEYGHVSAGKSRSQSVPNWDQVVPSLPLTYKELNAYYVTPGYYFSNRNYLVHFTYAMVDDKQFIGIIEGAHNTYTIGLNRYFGDNLVVKASYGQTYPIDYKHGKDGLFNGVAPDQPVSVYDISLNMTF